MISGSPKRCGLYLAMGAAFNVLILWLNENMKETLRELATTRTLSAAATLGLA